ncbi:hypothetical protein JTY60_02710 [symbiont of Argiope bruennichi]|uniref:hypothetical protein n=1 Tax=symbiont of Argiope bruennichi TaxID=2810479 RepID=UPI003DA4DCEC
MNTGTLSAFTVIFFIFSAMIFGWLVDHWNKWIYDRYKFQTSDIRYLYNLIIVCTVSLFSIGFYFFYGYGFAFESTIEIVNSSILIVYIISNLMTMLISYILIKMETGNLFNSLKRVKGEIKNIKKADSLQVEPISIDNYLYVYKFPHNCLIYDISFRYPKISQDIYLCSSINIPLVVNKIERLEYFIVINKAKIVSIYKFNKETKAIEITKDNFTELKEHFNLNDSLLLKNAVGNYVLNIEPISEEDFNKFKKTIKKLKHKKNLFIFYNF